MPVQGLEDTDLVTIQVMALSGAGPFKKKEKDGNIMGKIYYVMGKSASGKDTIYKRLVKELPELGTVRMYTTRPIRDGETNGVEYIFTDEKQLQTMKDAGKVIECRTYDTIYGPWSYFTADDGQIDLGSGSYLMMGTIGVL